MNDFAITFVICWLSGLTFLVWAIRRGIENAHRRRLSQPPPSPQLSAEEILKQRYVRGEIDTAQYEQYLEVLARTQLPAGQDQWSTPVRGPNGT